MFSAPLLLRIEFIQFPLGRVVFDITADVVVVSLVADNVVVEARLPNTTTNLLCYIPFCLLNDGRDRRDGHCPSVFFGIYLQQKMYVVWHNHVFIYAYAGITNRNVSNRFFYDISILRQPRRTGNARPYGLPQNTSAVLGAYRHEIGTGGIIIVFSQADVFPFW